MGKITDTMPIVAAQQGVWEGEYVHLNAHHEEIDRHKSRLICRLFDDSEGKARLAQSNIYEWPDGSREVRYFDGILQDGRINISNVNINGWVAPLEMDETDSTIMVLWTRAGEADFRYYEMITVAADRMSKNRTWHWYDKGRLFQRTLINENKISDDWKSFDDPSYLEYQARSTP